MAYKHFQVHEDYADELNVVLKCKPCGHIFSPGMSDEEMTAFLQGAVQVETLNV